MPPNDKDCVLERVRNGLAPKVGKYGVMISAKAAFMELDSLMSDGLMKAKGGPAAAVTAVRHIADELLRSSDAAWQRHEKGYRVFLYETFDIMTRDKLKEIFSSIEPEKGSQLAKFARLHFEDSRIIKRYGTVADPMKWTYRLLKFCARASVPNFVDLLKQ